MVFDGFVCGFFFLFKIGYFTLCEVLYITRFLLFSYHVFDDLIMQ